MVCMRSRVPAYVYVGLRTCMCFCVYLYIQGFMHLYMQLLVLAATNATVIAIVIEYL